MEKTDERPADSGVSLERPQEVWDDKNPGVDIESGRLLDEACAGLDAGGSEPYLSTLAQLANGGTKDCEVVAYACIALAQYYVDPFEQATNRKLDYDKGSYYAGLAKDNGLKEHGDWVQAVIDFRTEEKRADGREALLNLVRANHVAALHFVIYSFPLSMLRQQWGILYLAYVRWSNHPENEDAFSRADCRDKGADLLVYIKSVLKDFLQDFQNEPDGASLTRFKRQLSISAEAHPEGESLKVWKELNTYYTSANRRRGGMGRITVPFLLLWKVGSGILAPILAMRSSASFGAALFGFAVAAVAIDCLLIKFHYPQMPGSKYTPAALIMLAVFVADFLIWGGADIIVGIVTIAGVYLAQWYTFWRIGKYNI